MLVCAETCCWGYYDLVIRIMITTLASITWPPAGHSGEKLQTFFIVVTFSWSLASWLVHQWGHRLGSSQRLIGKFCW